jgi:hypothetical protein
MPPAIALWRSAWTAVAVAVVLTVSLPAAPAQAQTGDYIGRINALRTSRGLNALDFDGNMAGLAQQHSDEMAGAMKLYHTGNLRAGVSGGWSTMGENVGMGSNTDLIWNAFVNSPGHFENLVNPAFTHLGVGVAYDSRGIQWTTHRFIARPGGAPPPPPPPPPPPRPPAPRAPAPAPAPRAAAPAAPRAAAPAPTAGPAPAPAEPEPTAPPAEEPAPTTTVPQPSSEAVAQAARSTLGRWVTDMAAQAVSGPGSP